LNDEDILRALATVITTSSGERKIPVVATHGTAAWVEKEGAIPNSEDAFGVVYLGAHKLATTLKVSEELLNDSAFNLETYIAKEFARRIGRAEEQAFLVGNGVNKPTGLFATAQVGITSAASTAITLDEVLDLYHSLRKPYRRNAVFVMNDATVKAIRKLKDTSGQYLWQPSIKEATPDTILFSTAPSKHPATFRQSRRGTRRLLSAISATTG
jgi:HK97 family phage major capsid protein